MIRSKSRDIFLPNRTESAVKVFSIKIIEEYQSSSRWSFIEKNVTYLIKAFGGARIG